MTRATTRAALLADTALAGLEERVGDVAGVRTRWFVGGDGPPLVLVHGLGGGASNWVELAPLLARRHKLLVPDLPGHALSGPLPETPVDLGPYGAWLVALMEREGFAPAPVVGHSTGASVALRAAAARPDAVPGLVLAAAAGISTRRRAARVTLAILGVTRPGRLVAPGRAYIAASPPLRYPVFGRWGAVDPPALSAQAVRAYLAPQALHTAVGAAARALVREDSLAHLDGVRCPSLVLWGARDRLVPVDDGFAYARALGAPLRVVAAAGHLLIAERPDACAAAISDFLDRVREVDELPLEVEPLR